MTQDLIVSCMYWDGVTQPFFANLADNDWGMIKLASKLNAVPSTWNVGDIKYVQYNNENCPVRLVDKTGKYRRTADNSVAYLTFEFATAPSGYIQFNSSIDTVVEHSTALISFNSGDVYNAIEEELRNVVEQVNVPHGVGDGNYTMIYTPYKFFMRLGCDIVADPSPYYEFGMSTQERAMISVDEYYINRQTFNDFRTEKLDGSQGVTWTMSASTYWSHQRVPLFYVSGQPNNLDSNAGGNIVPRFAL